MMRGKPVGWIKSYRTMLENKILMKKPEYLAYWIVILHSVVIEDTDYTLTSGKVIRLKAGQMITSRDKLAQLFDKKCTTSELQRMLLLFQKCHMIEQQTTNKYRIITVLNWETYQSTEQQMNSKRTANEQQTVTKVNTNKEYKKKEDKNINIYSCISDSYNSICVDLPKIKSITKPRQTHINTLLKELESQGVTYEEYFKQVQASDFLTGRKGDWQANFDWIIKPSNSIKILEGVYANREVIANSGNKQSSINWDKLNQLTIPDV